MLLLQSSTKRIISPEEWDRRLAAVKLSKVEMNKLVMNFLVIEVSECCAEAPPAVACRASGACRSTHCAISAVPPMLAPLATPFCACMVP
jgi:hypothetical protein